MSHRICDTCGEQVTESWAVHRQVMGHYPVSAYEREVGRQRPPHFRVESTIGNGPSASYVAGRWYALSDAVFQARAEYASDEVRMVQVFFISEEGFQDRVALYRKDSALAVCTSDDPNDHQGDTCPVHEL